jgi:hypothetical protein
LCVFFFIIYVLMYNLVGCSYFAALVVCTIYHMVFDIFFWRIWVVYF